MRFPWACFAAVAFFLIAIVAQSFGALVVLHPPHSDSPTKNLTCISEDDGAALTWNDDPQTPLTDIKDFIPKRSAFGNISTCAIWNSKRCLGAWDELSDWQVVNSAMKPTGPVFDRRWEDFEEFRFTEEIHAQSYKLVKEVKKSPGTVWFSARAKHDVYVYLSEKNEPQDGPCIWIQLWGWQITKSVMQYCAKGAAKPKERTDSASCEYAYSEPESHKHKPEDIIDPYEWRTFKIEWSIEKGTISISNSNEPKPFLSREMPPDISYVSVRSDRTSRIRFHFYDYYLTETQNTVISTTEFDHSSKIFRAELLVGLCSKCKLNVNLTDEDGNNIETWTAKGDPIDPYGGLLTWQLVKFKTDSDHTRLKFKIESIFDGDEGTGQWAIDNFRVYESGEDLRESTITLGKKYSNPVACQKLSYKGMVTVPGSVSPYNSNNDKILSELPKFLHQGTRKLGKNGFICNPSGCVCDRGFTGHHCTEDCDQSWYGYNCKEKCGSCHNSEICLATTGLCPAGCEGHKLEPLCQTAIEAPSVENIGDKTATVLQRIELNPDQVTSVKMEIQEAGGSSMNYTANLNQSRISGAYEAHISGLNLSTVYTARTVVAVKVGDGTRLSTSPEFKFMTTCHGGSALEVVPDERSLTVRARHEDCKPNTYLERRYSVIVIDAFVGKTVGSPNFTDSFPFTKPDLKPATKYEVKIIDTGAQFELPSVEVWTSESAPSEVRNLRASAKGNTTVTLQWDTPLNENGIIREYNVSTKLLELKGCKDFGEKTPVEEVKVQIVTSTTAFFSELHPYAAYEASVTAYTSKEGLPATCYFETDPNEIPTSMVSNLRINEEQNRVEWDKPANCTKVSGPTNITNLFIKREHATIWNKNWERKVKRTFYDLEEYHLDPYTNYTVRACVIRDYNNPKIPDDCPQKTWQTKPAAPSAVRNLTLYDADPDTNTLSLRWLPPDPANGEIKSYVVSIINKVTSKKMLTEIQNKNLLCKLSEDYLCYENIELSPYTENQDREIQVYALNKDVKECGNPTTKLLGQKVFDKEPSEPKDLTHTNLTQGIVTLEWSRPRLSPTKITKFHVYIEFVDTDLKDPDVAETRPRIVDYAANPTQEKYTANLYLLPSTTYNISVEAENRRARKSIRSNTHLTVPSNVGFARNEKLELKQGPKSTIEVKVPVIMNATKNTWVTTTVNGFLTCVDKDSRTPSSTMTWVAKPYKVEKTGKKEFSVSGTNQVRDGRNCSLCVGETYEIVVAVANTTVKLSSTITLVEEKPSNSNLAWLLIIPILGICVLLLFIKYRKRNKCPLLKPEMVATGTSTVPSSPKQTTSPLATQHHVPDVVPYNPESCPVEIEDFEEYTKDALKSGLLRSQYEEFPRGLTKPCEYGKLPANASKNRWVNLIPYDDTRVVLKKVDDSHSDYINASYIPGYRNERAYIATQGPKLDTINDFWLMIWQEEVRVICMLANVIEHGRTKCAQYWPEVGAKMKYGNISVWNINQDVYIDYTIRTFELSLKKEKREVTHLHYTGWPDHGVPMFTQSVIPYLKRLQAMATGDEPVVVHCSAGVGRTGTIILCDTCLRQAKFEMVVDPAAVTGRMRKHRPRMVDNEQQYVFAHLAIMEYRLSEQTEIPCDEDSTKGIHESRKRLATHIKRVRDIIWGERVMHCIGEPNSPLPKDGTEHGIAVLVSADPSVGLFDQSLTIDMNRNHIQTVSIDGFKIENQYLTSWLPSPSTRSKLWKLIADDNIELVIILQRPDDEDPTCCDLMPSESNPISSRHVQVEMKGSFDEDEYFTIDKLLLTKMSEKVKSQQSVTVLTCRGWGCGTEGKPPAVGALVSLWMASEKVSRSESPTLVLCHDGVTGCGLYVALSFVLERIAVEKECDVISAVRKVRRFKPQFGQTMEQFEYLYDAALNYVERFKTYSNFS